MIYLAVPYSGMEEASFDAVNHYAGILMGEGHFVFSPISMCHPIARRLKLPTHFEYWKEFDHRWIEICDCIVVLCLNGWGESRGVIAELNYALHLKKEIHYRYPNQIPSGIEVIDGN